MKKFSKDQIAVLLVDDIDKNIKNCNYILKNNGFYVQTATNGWEALQFIENEEFHVLMVCDEINHMRYEEIIMLTRETFNKGDLPILVYSKEGDPSREDEVKAIGGNIFITNQNMNEVIKKLKLLYMVRQKFQEAKKAKVKEVKSKAAGSDDDSSAA